VPEGGGEGADKELQYVDVAQDLDQSPEGPKANLASEGKPRIINSDLLNLCNYPCYVCAFKFMNWMETLDAWSIGTYALILVG
jgi:hypothetical protein